MHQRRLISMVAVFAISLFRCNEKTNNARRKDEIRHAKRRKQARKKEKKTKKKRNAK